jgi:pyridoxine 4-dehydrogenase
VSNVTVTHLEEALAIAPVVCVQNRYALDQREHEPVLLACVERSIAFVPYFSLIGAGDARQAGVGAVRTDPPQLAEVARRLGATPAQVRLAWTLHHVPNVLAIPGTGDPGHLTDNIAAAALRLSPDELTVLSGRPAG